MERGDGLHKSNTVATILELKEKEKEIMSMSPQQEDVVNKPKLT